MDTTPSQPTPQVVYVMAGHPPAGAIPVAGPQGYPYMYPVAGQPMQGMPQMIPIAMPPGSSPVLAVPAPTPGGPTMVQAFPINTPTPMDAAIADVQVVKTIRERILEREYSPELGKWINQAWELYKVNYNWLKVLVWTCILILVACIPFGGGLLIAVPMHVGFTVAVFNAIRSNSMHPNELVVRDFIPNVKMALLCIVLTLLLAIFIVLGLVALIVPGIYLMFALSFAFPLYIEFRELGMSMMDSITVSNKQVWKQFILIVVFLVVLNGLASIGMLAFLVGIVATVPLAFIAHCIAVRDIFGLREVHEYEMSGKI